MPNSFDDHNLKYQASLLVWQQLEEVRWQNDLSSLFSYGWCTAETYLYYIYAQNLKWKRFTSVLFHFPGATVATTAVGGLMMTGTKC